MEFYVYRDTYESITKDTHRIMKDNPGFMNGKGTWHNGSKEFRYSNGSIIFFQYTKGGKHTLGQTAGGIYFEQVESIKEEDYDLIMSRLSQWGPAAVTQYLHKHGNAVKANQLMRPRNYLFLSANPKANWVKGRYIDTEGKPDIIKNGSTLIVDNLKKENIKRIHLSTYDNIHNLGDEYLAQIESSSEAYKKQFYDGSWEFNTGLIYNEFNSADFADGGHVVNFEWEAANSYLHSGSSKFMAGNFRTITAIDPGYVKSKFVALLTAILPDGTIYCFDEVVRNGKSVEDWEKIGPVEFAKLLKEKYKEYRYTPNTTLIDPASHSENAGAGSVSGMLLKAGIPTTSAKKSKEYQSIMGIKDLLKGRKIIVNVRCQELIREFGLFSWDERKVQTGDQKPLDEDNDLLDSLRYVFVASPHPQTANKSYSEVLSQNFSPDALYRNWAKSWYGVKEKKKNPMAIDNKSKGNWGV